MDAIRIQQTCGRPWSLAAVVCLAAGVLLARPDTALAQDPLLQARDLYAAAAYEDALTLLNRVRASGPRAEDRRFIDQYRAFCLLALGRTAEAERAIEAVVEVAPAYRPSDADASPRVRDAFRGVRRRMLPGIIQQKYADAKNAYDQNDAAAAASGFKQVLDLLADPDIAASAARPPLSEIKTLATGFRDLSTAAAAPAPVSSPPIVRSQPAPVPAPSRPVPGRVYGPEDQDVLPPVVVRQSLAALSDVFALRPGILEIIVDENGEVESATVRTSVNPVYDRLVIATAKTWRYKPALLDGVAVKFRKIIQIDLRSTR